MNGLIIANPYDIPALTPEEYHDSLLLMLDWDQKENLTDLFFFNMADGCPGIEQEILEFSKKTPKPIIVSYQGGGEAEKDGIKFLNENHIPAYPVATRAAKSAVTLIEYSNIWKKRGINKD